MSANFNLDYLNSLKLVMPHSGKINLVLVGCGGTGSWLAPAVARVAKLLIDKLNREIRIFFVDPDKIEEKNIYRQNFCQAEIGRNKAVSLAERFGLAWGMDIMALAKPFEDCNVIGGQAVVIGCVDNSMARQSIKAFYDHSSSNVWWLDCGNEKNSGQVLLGYQDKSAKDIYKLTGYCQWLPSPALQHPELLTAEVKKQSENLSCADMVLRDSQGMAINQRVAAEAADYLVRMLITQDLHKFATYFDLMSGSARSEYITQERIDHFRSIKAN